jgi:chaperonin GroEL
MNKRVNSGAAAMEKILEGVNLVANPVISTLSPKGRTVVISKSAVIDYGIRNFPLEVTKDGYRVAMNIASPDPEIQVGVLFAQQAIEKQMTDVGDATTTCALMVKYLLEAGLKEIENGKSHVAVKTSILNGVEYVISELKKMSTEIAGNAELVRQVATVSANGDEKIGDLIAEAFEKIGEDGVIDIQESKGLETKIEISPGFKFPKGYASPYFLTKGAASAVLENPYILIYDRAITKLEDKENGTGLMPVLEKIFTQQQVTGNKRPLMIFCDNW